MIGCFINVCVGGPTVFCKTHESIHLSILLSTILLLRLVSLYNVTSLTGRTALVSYFGGC